MQRNVIIWKFNLMQSHMPEQTDTSNSYQYAIILEINMDQMLDQISRPDPNEYSITIQNQRSYHTYM